MRRNSTVNPDRSCRVDRNGVDLSILPCSSGADWSAEEAQVVCGRARAGKGRLCHRVLGAIEVELDGVANASGKVVRREVKPAVSYLDCVY